MFNQSGPALQWKHITVEALNLIATLPDAGQLTAVEHGETLAEIYRLADKAAAAFLQSEQPFESFDSAAQANHNDLWRFLASPNLHKVLPPVSAAADQEIHKVELA